LRDLKEEASRARQGRKELTRYRKAKGGGEGIRLGFEPVPEGTPEKERQKLIRLVVYNSPSRQGRSSHDVERSKLTISSTASLKERPKSRKKAPLSKQIHFEK
jgi:hypothetical protein